MCAIYNISILAQSHTSRWIYLYLANTDAMFARNGTAHCKGAGDHASLELLQLALLIGLVPKRALLGQSTYIREGEKKVEYLRVAWRGFEYLKERVGVGVPQGERMGFKYPQRGVGTGCTSESCRQQYVRR